MSLHESFLFSATFPIDTTKTRLQIQGQVISKSTSKLKYRGMVHAMIRISKEEGVRSLFNGIAPALLRQATYGTIKIGLYHGIKRAIVTNPEQETIYYNIVAGVLAGAISSSLCNPTDVLKVRLQAQTQGIVNMQSSMIAMFVDIYRLEGLRGLYRVCILSHIFSIFTILLSYCVAGKKVYGNFFSRRFWISRNCIVFEAGF